MSRVRSSSAKTPKTPDYVRAAKTAADAFALLRGESDRGCALIGAAMLEQNLAGLLWAFFEKDGESARLLLEAPNAPLSTFSSRINAARALGIIAAPFRRDLDLVRRIRNAAAHFDRRGGRQIRYSFAADEIAARCNEISSVPPEVRNSLSPRQIFELFTTLSSALLAEHVRIHDHVTRLLPRPMAIRMILELAPTIDFVAHFRSHGSKRGPTVDLATSE